MKLNILSNYAEYSKRLVLWYILPHFTILKSSNPIGQPARLEKMTSIRRQDCPVQRSQVSKAFTNLSFNKSNNGDHKDPLESNKPGLFKAPTRFKAFAKPKALARPFQAPLLAF